MSEQDRACDGGRILEDGDYAECVECRMRLRWDMQEHPYFGWQNCPVKRAERLRQPRELARDGISTVS